MLLYELRRAGERFFGGLVKFHRGAFFEYFQTSRDFGAFSDLIYLSLWQAAGALCM